MNGRSYKISTGYVLLTAFAVMLSWELHEFAHWAMGEWLGHDMTMTLNKTFFTITSKGQSVTTKDNQLINAVGPVVTLFEALLIFILLQRRKNIFLYTFLFTCFYMRLLAAAMSFIHPNDEARISQWLGLGTFTLPIVMLCILFYLLYSVSKNYKLRIKFNLLNLLLIIIFTSMIILSDQYFHIIILK